MRYLLNYQAEPLLNEVAIGLGDDPLSTNQTACGLSRLTTGRQMQRQWLSGVKQMTWVLPSWYDYAISCRMA